MTTGVFSGLTFGFSVDEQSRTEYISTFFSFGIVFLAMFAGAAYVVGKLLKFKIDRVPGWLFSLKQVRGPNDPRTFAFDAKGAKQLVFRVAALSVTTWVLLLLPLVFLVLWAAMVLNKVSPADLGIGMLTIWPAVVLLVLGLFTWRARGWRFGPVPGGAMVSRVQSFLGTSMVLCVVWELLTIFTDSFSYLANSWVFLSFNMMFVILAAFFYFSAPPGYGTVGLLNRARRYLKKHREAGSASRTVDDGEARPTNSAPPKAAHRFLSDKHSLSALAMYTVSVVILIIYSVVNLFRAEDAIDSGKFLGLATSGTILILDAGAAGLVFTGLLQRPGMICTVLAASRMLLIFFGARFWLIGTTAVYFLYGIVLAYLGIRQLTAANELAAEDKVQTSLGRTIARIVLSPIGILSFFTVCFTILLIVVRVAEPGGLPLSKVTLVSATGHDQYEFGVAAIISVLIFAAAFNTWGMFVVAKHRFTRPVLISALLVEVFILVSGIFLHFITESWVILSTAIFVPPALFCLWLMYNRWVRDDYHVLPALLGKIKTHILRTVKTGINIKPRHKRGGDDGDSKEADDTADDGGEGAAESKAGDDAGETKGTPDGPPMVAALRTPAPKTDDTKGALADHMEESTARDDHFMIVQAIIVTACVIGFGALIATQTSPSWAGWACVFTFLMLLCTIAPIIQWFNTFEVTKFMIGNGVLALLLHLALHGYALAQFVDETENKKSISAVIMSFVLYPTLVASGVSLYKYIDDNYTITRFVVICLASSQLFVVAAILMFGVLFDSWMVMLGLSVVYLIAVGVLATVFKWASSGFWLPKLWRRILQIIVGLVIIGGLVITAALWFIADEGGAALVAFSCCYAVVFASVLMTAVSKQLHAKSAYRYASSSVFPIVTIIPGSDGVVSSNSTAGMMLFAATLGYLWGVAAATFLVPPYLGLLVCGICKVMGFLYCVSLSRQMEQLVSEACESLRLSDEVDKLDKTIVTSVANALRNLADVRSLRTGTPVASAVAGAAERKAGAGSGAGAGAGAGSGMEDASAATDASDLTVEPADLDPHAIYHTHNLLKKVGEREALLTKILFKPSTVTAEDDPDAAPSVRSQSNPMHLTGDIETGESKGEGGEDADVPLARFLAKTVDSIAELDADIAASGREEAHFNLLAQHFVVRAGQREADKIRQRWFEFISWCGKPKQAGLLDTHHLKELAAYASQPASQVPGSAQRLLRKWNLDLGKVAAADLAKSLDKVRAAHQAAKEEARRAVERRRREDELAAKRRAEAAEARAAARREEAERRRQELLRQAEEEERRRKLEMQRKREEEEAKRAEEARRAESERRRIQALADAEERKREEEREARRKAEEEARRQAAEAALAAEEARRKKEAEEAKQQAAMGGGGDEVDFKEEDKKVLAKVRALERNAGSGKWTDSSFDGRAALGPDVAGDVGTWARIDEIMAEPAVQVDGYSADDIRQGSLGDCWLLSAMSVIATRPELMNHVLVTRDYSRQGVYACRFHKDGEWKTVFVDDRFPCKKNVYKRRGKLWRGRADPSAGKMYAPSFVSSADANEMWMMIIEKAYAKYFGSYTAIAGGLVQFAFADFTGGDPESVDVTSAKVRPAIDDGSLFKKLERYAKLGYLLGAGSPSGSDADVSASGVVQGHAYSMLRVEEVDGHQLLQLRNPWGSTEWNGDWSDKDTKNWTRRIKHKLHYDPEDEDADDGTFWISFQDFVRNYEDIYICRMFKTVSQGGSWYRYTATAEWNKETAGGCPNFRQTDRNTQWYINPQAPTSINVTLEQRDGRGTDQGNLPIGMKLLDKGGRRCQKVFSGETVLASKYSNSRAVSMEGHIRPRDTPLTLFASTFKPDRYTTYRVTVYTQKPLVGATRGRLPEIPRSVPAM